MNSADVARRFDAFDAEVHRVESRSREPAVTQQELLALNELPTPNLAALLGSHDKGFCEQTMRGGGIGSTQRPTDPRAGRVVMQSGEPGDEAVRTLADTPFVQAGALTPQGQQRLVQARQQLGDEVGMPVDECVAALQVAQDHWTSRIDQVDGAFERAMQAQALLTQAMAPHRDLAALREECATRLDALREADPSFDEARIGRTLVDEDGTTLAALEAASSPDDLAQQIGLAGLRLQIIEMTAEQQAPTVEPTRLMTPQQFQALTTDLPADTLVNARFRLGPRMKLEDAVQPYAAPGHRLTGDELEQAVQDNEPVIRPLARGVHSFDESPELNTFYEINLHDFDRGADVLNSAYSQQFYAPMQIRTADNSRRFDLYRHGHGFDPAEGTTIIDERDRAIPMPRGAVQALLDELQLGPDTPRQLVISYGDSDVVMRDDPFMYWSRADADAALAALQAGRAPSSLSTDQVSALKQLAARTQPDNEALSRLLMADRSSDVFLPRWRHDAQAPLAPRVREALTNAGLVSAQTPAGDIEHIADAVFNRAQSQAFDYRRQLIVPPEVQAGQRTLEEFVRSRRSMAEFLDYIDPPQQPERVLSRERADVLAPVPESLLPSTWERLAAIDDRAQRAEQTSAVFTEWSDGLRQQFHQLETTRRSDTSRHRYAPIAEHLLANYGRLLQFEDGRDVVSLGFVEEDEDDDEEYREEITLSRAGMTFDADMAFVLDGLQPIERELDSSNDDDETIASAARQWRDVIDAMIDRQVVRRSEGGIGPDGDSGPYVQVLVSGYGERFRRYGFRDPLEQGLEESLDALLDEMNGL